MVSDVVSAMDDGRLLVEVGVATRTGRRPDNQDFAAVCLAMPAQRASHGIAVALADGVGGARGGRAAAELACREGIDAYYAQTLGHGVAAAAAHALASYNRWLNAIGKADPAMRDAACTIAFAVLRGRAAHVLHAGDSRIWHFRDDALTCLTTDHVLPGADRSHVLTRCLGAEATLRLDLMVQPLTEYDRLLLTTDGVHAVLSNAALTRLLAGRATAEHAAGAIVDAALAAGSSDNATAIVLDVLALPPPDRADIAAAAAGLPIPPAPNAGQTVDGYALNRLLAEGRTSRVFLATDTKAGAGAPAVVLKFPKPTLLSEHAARAAFVREAMVGAMVNSRHVVRVLPVPPDRQTRLYVAMRHHDGITLEARLARGRIGLAAALRLAADIGRGVAALHRAGIVHRDIKPENILLQAAGPPILLDLGVALVPRLEEFAAAEIPGTPGYMAPELYAGSHGDAATDQFALGATLYRLFAGVLPYGEIEPFTKPTFKAPADPARLQPELPSWLAAALRRAAAVRAADRFGDVLELVAVLDGGSARATPTSRRAPLIERAPVRVWQTLCAALAAALALSLVSR